MCRSRERRTLVFLPEDLGEENAAFDTLIPHLSFERELGHLAALVDRRQLKEVSRHNKL